MNTKSIGNVLRTRLARGVAILALAGAVPLSLGADKEVSTGKVKVNIDDLQGQVDPRLESPREDLLESAFYSAASSTDVIGKYDLSYNEAQPSDVRGYLSFNIIGWRRSIADIYECHVVVRYRDFDGNEIDLGSFQGRHSGIAVTNRRDIGEAFSECAEDAFKQALKKLEETVS